MLDDVPRVLHTEGVPQAPGALFRELGSDFTHHTHTCISYREKEKGYAFFYFTLANKGNTGASVLGQGYTLKVGLAAN